MRFSMRPIDETIEDIRRQAQLNRGKKITSCFLQDGDALVLKTDYLLRGYGLSIRSRPVTLTPPS